MGEVRSGHMPGGNRISPKKDMFFNMTEAQVERAIRQAYRNGVQVGGTPERILIQGRARDGLPIEMVLNRQTRTIETAYPVLGRGGATWRRE